METHICEGELARYDFGQYFERGTRVDGKTFYKCVDCAPKDLREFIRSVHEDYFCDCFPNDWIYEFIADAFDDLKDNDIEDLSIEPDCYYYDLHKWFSEPYAHEYCNQIIRKGDWDNRCIYSIIGGAQLDAKECIYHAVNEFIKSER